CLDDVSGGQWVPSGSKGTVIACQSCPKDACSVEYTVDASSGECVMTKYHTRLSREGDRLMNTHKRGCRIQYGHECSIRFHYMDRPATLDGCTLICTLSPNTTLWSDAKRCLFYHVTHAVDTHKWEIVAIQPPELHGCAANMDMRRVARLWGEVYMELQTETSARHPTSERFVVALSLDTLGWREVTESCYKVEALLALDDHLHVFYIRWISDIDHSAGIRGTKSRERVLFHTIYTPETDKWTDPVEVPYLGAHICVVHNAIHLYTTPPAPGDWTVYTTATGWKPIRSTGCMRDHNLLNKCPMALGRHALVPESGRVLDTVSGELCHWKHNQGPLNRRPFQFYDSSALTTGNGHTLYRIEVDPPGSSGENPYSSLDSQQPFN
ncbi:hypothetical protein KIPB_004650, partial [Kipferlia bialata]